MAVTSNSNASQVRVGVRIRPLTSKETSDGGKTVVNGSALDRTISLSKRKFTYDNVFPSNVSQTDLYANVAPPLLNSFLNGYNATVLAYGQTGAGKTFTMGSEAGGNFVENVQTGCILGDKDGLIPRFMSDMFASLFQRREASEKKALLQSCDDDAGDGDENTNNNNGKTQQQQQQQQQQSSSISLIDFKVTASFLEVYGEDIFDLLDEDRTPLKIREDSKKDVIVVGLQSTPIANAFEAMGVLNTGTMNRTTAATLMNHTSSRSHAVFTVNLQQTTRSNNSDGDEITTTSRFTFVDLAGSERMKKTGAEGERAKEGIKINEGLLALGNVINALADDERQKTGERVHVPYRQSKLTRLLQDALGGNSQTLFLACVSPSDTNASETLSTLHYANRARNIKNAPTKNVDATAEELRRLRTLTNLLKCELIKQRFDGVSSSTTSVDPELERANGNMIIDPADIGVLTNEGLMQRDDVMDYMKQIEEKASTLSGSAAPTLTMNFNAPPQTSTFASDHPMSQSILEEPAVTPSNCNSQNSCGADHADDEVEDDEYSDMDANPDEDMQIIEDLLESTQHEEQLSKIEGDIEEQEERLLRLKGHMKVYNDMKEKYVHLQSDVERLEHEKQELAEKLEKANSDPSTCSLSIKTKLEQVKASLARARQDVRKQQQKCRDAELEAQRCKGLERRIEELKFAKASLMRKQKEDAKRQKDFSKTKAREIQMLRRQEKSAQKKVIKVEGENQRLKMNIDRSKTRYEMLQAKLKQTEASLRSAHARKRSHSVPNSRRDAADVDADGSGQFAPSSGKVNSIKFVLDKTVSDRVALSQNRSLYAQKTAERKSLMQSMADEVHVLNELKSECESKSEAADDDLAEINDHESNVQDYLIQIELVENSLEELQARHPSIEDDNEEDEANSNVFEGHEQALKMLSKLNAPLLRTLLLNFLGTCYASKLARQRLKEDLVQSEAALDAMENEAILQNEKMGILTKSLERLKNNSSQDLLKKEKVEALEKELDETNAKLIACVSEKATMLNDLEKSNKALTAAEEREKKAVSHVAVAVAQTKDQLSSSHTKQIEELRAELETSTSSELERAKVEVKEQYLSEIESIAQEMKEQHSSELERVRLDLSSANKSQSEQLAQHTASHEKELKSVRSETDVLVSEAITRTKDQLSAAHSLEIDKIRMELESLASERQRVQVASEEQHVAEIEHIKAELIESHSAEIERVKSDLLATANASESDKLSQLAASHQKEVDLLHSKLEEPISQAIAKAKNKQTESHSQEIERLKAKLSSSSFLEIQRVRAASEEQHAAEIEQIKAELKQSHAAELDEVKTDTLMNASCAQSHQLAQLSASHEKELVRVRFETEVATAQAVAEAEDQLRESHAQDIEQLQATLKSSQEQKAVEIENIRAELKATHVSELHRVKIEALEMTNSVQSDQLTQLAASQKELERTKEALSMSQNKLLKTKEQLAQMHVQQKEQDSIEDQIINASVSKKDDLLREFEKTSLLKELEQTKAALSKSKHQQARAETELASMLSQQKQMNLAKEQLNSSLAEKDALLKELERTKEVHCLSEGEDAQTRQLAVLDSNRDEASSQPQDVKEHSAPMLRRHMSNSLSIDTSSSVADASLDSGPSSAPARSSSSAVVPTYKKFHSLKQRYLEKVRESSPSKGGRQSL